MSGSINDITADQLYNGKLCNRVGRPPTAPGYRLPFQQMNPSLLVVVMMQVFLDISLASLRNGRTDEDEGGEWDRVSGKSRRMEAGVRGTFSKEVKRRRGRKRIKK